MHRNFKQLAMMPLTLHFGELTRQWKNMLFEEAFLVKREDTPMPCLVVLEGKRQNMSPL